RLIRDRQPKVFQYCLNHRGKREVSQLLNLVKQDMVVHVSGMFGAARNNLALVSPLVEHPLNRNGVVVYDLSVDPAPLLSLSAEDIRRRLFTAEEDLSEGEERIPLKTVHINKCPVVAPVSVLRPQDQDRLELDLSICVGHRKKLLADGALKLKLREVFSEPPKAGSDDPDQMLYSGGFFSPSDRNEMSRLLSFSPSELSGSGVVFKDKRLDEMLFRYRGRHYSTTLNSEEQLLWRQYCHERLSGQRHRGDDRLLSFDRFWEDLASVKEDVANDSKKGVLLEQLAVYVRDLQQELA
ncbi:MAG: exodeoxyribonuclease I, partial [Endozoicomonas sp.]